MYEDIEAVLDEHVRPLLRTHGGEMEIIEVEDGVVRFKLKGKCAGCPAADLTTEELIQTALTEHLPHIKRRCWCRISARSCWTRPAPS